jgi:hypothetical protein
VLDPVEETAIDYVCNGVAGTTALVRQSVEPAGAHCATGGTKIESGLDTNANGALDDAEVTATSYVCNGAPGPTGPTGPAGSPSLVMLTAEPAGANCANGGQRVEVGVDADGSGTLQPSEIAATGFVCNGANGSSSALTQTTTIAPGTTCTYGGELVQAGIDASGDGVMQPSEILFGVTICTLRLATPIAPGSTCAAGGTRYDYGRDRNLDNVLETSEIERSENVCAACGTVGTPCCLSGGPLCTGANVACDTRYGMCAPCGALGGPCCGTDQTCRCADSWTQCGGLGGTYTSCLACGGPGEPCCRPYPPHSACGVTGNCKPGLTCTAFGSCQ